MAAVDGLISAMHMAGGSTARQVSEWLALAQEHAALRDAFRESHGKRLPTPQALGLWLSERMGTTAGPLRLEGRHSPRKKAWIYRVIDYVKLAELARQEAERQAQMRAQIEEQRREQAARQAAEVAALQAAAAERMHSPPPEQYEYEEQRYASDGTPQRRQLLINPKTGEPIRKRPTVEIPAQVETLEQAARPDDRRPPWLQRGETGPRDKDEWNAWQRQRTGQRTGGLAVCMFEEPVTGFSDPSGVVSANIMAEASSVYVCGRWPKFGTF